MEIEGLDTPLYRTSPEARSAHGNSAKTPADLVERASQFASLELWESALEHLDQTLGMPMRREDQMRERYLRGCYFERQDDREHAFKMFEEAFDIAQSLDDRPSMIALACSAGGALHDWQRFSNAREYFTIAYDTWLAIVPSLPSKSVGTQVALLYLLSRDLWQEGDFSAAHGRLALAVTLAESVPAAQRSPALERDYGSSLWMLALVFSCESDARDGDLSYLRAAEECLGDVRRRYERVGVNANSMGRCYVLRAHNQFDIAAQLLSLGDSAMAARARKRGQRYAAKALTYFPYDDDIWGELLAQLAEIRGYMWRPERMSAAERSQIEESLEQIERRFRALDDTVGQGKVATMRAEWLHLLDETARARTALTEALAFFNRTGAGEASRAYRLRRSMILTPINPTDADTPRTDPDSDISSN